MQCKIKQPSGQTIVQQGTNNTKKHEKQSEIQTSIDKKKKKTPT